jgi:nucleoside-diphosphate-sugar epimerase
MPAVAQRVRRGRSAASTVAVTGAAGELGRRLLARLAANDDAPRLIGIDTIRGTTPDVTWRIADVRDPALASRLNGVDTLVHLAADRRDEGDSDERRAVNVRGTEVVLAAAAGAGVARVVLVTSAMVYGAVGGSPVPLPEDTPVRAEADEGLVGDWVQIERAAEGIAARADPPRLTMVRPASVVGPVADGLLPRLFEAPRLLALRDGDPHWQFCHVDDLVSALEWAALGRVDGVVTVGSDGWLSQHEVEQISGLRSIAVPASLAFATAERLQRVGVLPAPASELHYLLHPWVVGSQQRRAAGWEPQWDNLGALRAHLDALGDRAGRGALVRVQRRDATRAAAGATVAVVGALAIARSRAARRRRRG